MSPPNRNSVASAPRPAAEIQWQPRGLRAELDFPRVGAATGGVAVEIQRDTVTLTGWAPAGDRGRRIAWRLEIYGEHPAPLGDGQAIAEALLSRLHGLLPAIDAARLSAPGSGAIVDPGPSYALLEASGSEGGEDDGA